MCCQFPDGQQSLVFYFRRTLVPEADWHPCLRMFAFIATGLYNHYLIGNDFRVAEWISLSGLGGLRELSIQREISAEPMETE